MKNILFIGDVVGRPGRRFLAEQLPELRQTYQADFIIANGENAAAGAGITGKIARTLLQAGLDGITLGDHVWDQKVLVPEIDQIEALCRPANLPRSCPGKEYLILEKEGFRLGLFTVLGRTFMSPCNCPFLEADRILAQLSGQVDAFIVEIHAEATSEKLAIGRYLDGRVAAVIGTHTHVPTADSVVLPKGTAYVTDIGMTGPYESILGRKIEPVLGRFIDGMPRRFDVADEDVRISGVALTIDEKTGLAGSIELITVCQPMEEKGE